MNRYELKLQTFYKFAEQLASLSTCKRMKVGCIIVPADFTCIHAIGYNGPACGRDNDACLNLPQKCECAHAEANAISKLPSARNLTLVSTHGPCIACANSIINCRKVRKVVYGYDYHDPRGLVLLQESGILLDKLVPSLSSDMPSSFTDASGFKK